MEFGLNVHRINQSTTYSTGGTVKNTQSPLLLKGKKLLTKEVKQLSVKFTEMDLRKMLKDKGFPLWIIMETLNKFRANKEKKSSQTNSNSPFKIFKYSMSNTIRKIKIIKEINNLLYDSPQIS